MPHLRCVAALVASQLLAACANPDAPAHDVLIRSTCNGEERSGVFHFPDVNFDPSCSGGLFTGTCSSNHAEGTQLDGDLVVKQLRLTGSSEDSMRYDLWFDHPRGDFDPSPYENRPIECYWYRFDDTPRLTEVGKRTDCYFSNEGCWAELTML